MSVKSRTSRNAVFVLSLYDTGLAAVRGLARQGIPVVGVDFELGNAGFASRYCRALHCPHPEQAPEELLELLLAEGRREPRPAMLFPASDAFALFMSRYREQLGAVFRFILAPPEVMEALVNKRLQYELAERVGIPFPPTFYPESLADVERIAPVLDYPAVVKPYYGHRFREQFSADKGFKVHSAGELRERYGTLFDVGAAAVVQPMIPGPIENLLMAGYYIGRNGELLGSFTCRKLRQYPLEFGIGTFMESYVDPALFELGLRFCQEIGYRGVANIEFKINAATGRYELIELNPRHLAPGTLADRCGVNFPLLQYCDLFDEPLTPSHAFPLGVRWLLLRGDFFAFLELYRAGQLSIGGWVASLLTARTFSTFAWDDPGPFLKRHHYGKDYVRAIRQVLAARRKAR